MYLTLSWDLFIVVFFAVIMTYTFIIGKHEAVKIVLASYAAIVSVQGLGKLLDRFAPELQMLWGAAGVTPDNQVLSMIRLFLFVVFILFLAIRGGFQVAYQRQESAVINGVLTGVFGFVTAGLLLSTLLTYVAGVPLLDMTLADNAELSPLIQQSQLIQLMVFNQDIWFALPALLLIGVGIADNR
jgi:hypothetical protein